MFSPLFILAIVSLLSDGINSGFWATAPTSSTAFHDDILYACAEQQVEIPWQFALSAGDQLSDIKWYFEGSSHQLIAVYADGHFLPLPAFSDRVEQFDNAGLILRNVRVADSGNYSVVISIYTDAGAFSMLERSVFVQIGDTLMTKDGRLQIGQKTEAVLDSVSNQWAIQLQCGTFTYRADPPFQIEWMTPASSRIFASSDYSLDNFNLLLDNPVLGGNYSCHIPLHQAAAACLKANETDLASATIYVDKMLARLTILESENQQLKEKLNQSNGSCIG